MRAGTSGSSCAIKINLDLFLLLVVVAAATVEVVLLNATERLTRTFLEIVSRVRRCVEELSVPIANSKP